VALEAVVTGAVVFCVTVTAVIMLTPWHFWRMEIFWLSHNVFKYAASLARFSHILSQYICFLQLLKNVAEQYSQMNLYIKRPLRTPHTLGLSSNVKQDSPYLGSGCP